MYTLNRLETVPTPNEWSSKQSSHLSQYDLGVLMSFLRPPQDPYISRGLNNLVAKETHVGVSLDSRPSPHSRTTSG